ncbi:MAG: DNA polymerase III subunit alpha [candidate division Zixibacteria bacterium]|nr:DNA polymerase III subunit alpha [candidate division Zixibacteria bacterium]
MNCALPVCRSSFSLRYGTTPPEQLAQAAEDCGYPALILADRNNLYGCYDFYYAAKECGLQPIIGAIVTTHFGDITLLCENHDGFRNLSKLITHHQLHGTIQPDLLSHHAKDLLGTTSPATYHPALHDIFRSALFIPIGHDKPSQAYRFADKAGIKAVALPPVSFLRKEDYATHRLLRAIDGGHLITHIPPDQLASPDEYLRPPDWYNHLYAPYPDIIHNCRELHERCNLIFPNTKNILPYIAITGDHFERLRTIALSGLQNKLRTVTGPYQARLEYELSVIRRTGFVDYFLIVNDIITFCKKTGITAVGRGSAAGSLVSYSLGITRVDPIREGLYFERFLNEARSDCPDIDLDIDWRKRDDVLAYLYRTYGDEHIAMMASYIRFQPRLAVRETAKALGIAPEEINRFVKRLPWSSMEKLDGSIARLPAATRSQLDWQRFAPVMQGARAIAELPRHLGIHPGGVVITPRPLTDYIPLERAAKGIVVTQCDMYQAEKIGLVKIDILGQRGLAVIADCLAEMKKRHGDDFEIPDDDDATYRLLRTGKTIGVFQIESPGLRALLRVLKPRVLNDITLALALIRPGASDSGMKQIFLNRFHGCEQTVYPHPNLTDILRETHGVFIYQEQVILAGQCIAGFNLPASDLLRRSITKKRLAGENQKLTRRFLDGADRNGIDQTTAQGILSQLRQFASFGFCKAHAATYGHLAYQSAYFKTHQPDVFMAAVLHNDGGYYPSAVYVAEARRLGVTVMPPDCTLSERRDSLHGGRIYLGLSRVREITRRSLDQIESGRPFTSLADFLSRVDISEREVENLIRIGFFDSRDTSRPRLLWQYRLWGRAPKRRDDDLFGGRVLPPATEQLPPLRQFSRYDIFRAEKAILDMPASFHPLSLFNTHRPVDVAGLARPGADRTVTISGWLADRKRIKTRDGKSMVFLTFDTVDDTFEVILFPDTYDRFSETIRTYRYLAIDGRINFDDGTPALIAQCIRPAETGLPGAKHI